MKTKYIDLITQTYEFPQEEFQVEDNELIYNGVPIMDIIKQYGTPLKITFLPKISQNIQRARRWFNVAIAKPIIKALPPPTVLKALILSS